MPFSVVVIIKYSSVAYNIDYVRLNLQTHGMLLKSFNMHTKGYMYVSNIMLEHNPVNVQVSNQILYVACYLMYSVTRDLTF